MNGNAIEPPPSDVPPATILHAHNEAAQKEIEEEVKEEGVREFFFLLLLKRVFSVVCGARAHKLIPLLFLRSQNHFKEN